MSSLINRKAVKSFILAKIQALRPGLDMNRVSGDAFTYFENLLKVKIEESIKSHPSIGKTFKPE